MGSRLKKKADRAAKLPKPDSPIDLPPWRKDWLYDAVFRQVDRECLESGVPRLDGRGRGMPVLVLEYERSADDHVCGRVGRGWMRDERGLIELDADQRSLLLAHLWDDTEDGRMQLVRFHISPDRRRVVWGWHGASIAGQGTTLIVEGIGVEARLVRDPTAGLWRS
jgi:hypothetical protein